MQLAELCPHATHRAYLFWGKDNAANANTVADKGWAIGPDLSRAGRQRSIAYLRESIVDPNRDITPGYNSVVVVTKAGKKITGVEQAFDNFSARLVDLAGQVHSFQKEEVTSMKREFRSLMPDSYRSAFPANELDDLVAYLARLDGKKANPAGPAPGKTAVPAQSDPNWTPATTNYRAPHISGGNSPKRLIGRFSLTLETTKFNPCFHRLWHRTP
jgi:putative heme-binding domain-containing protein